MTKTAYCAHGKDAAYLLHGYTNLQSHLTQGPLIIESGDGIYVVDSEGKRYIEGMAGLWSTALGFSEQRLVQAASRQMEKLPYYHNFSHKSHSQQIELAERLVKMAPVPMSKAYFANSGSEANDTAIKMIWYHFEALGQSQRKKIISRQRAYHGTTMASASLTGLPNNHRSFGLPLPFVRHTLCPHYWREGLPGETEEQFATRCADELEALILREGPDTVAAFFAEPVMGAGGVVVPPATYWEKIQDVLKRYEILLVADEVICGFGRTGRMFGCETFGIKPDILELSKQLTSSYMPMSALLVNDRVFGPIAEESGRIGVFGHGFTGGGHPVAAAVANETLDIIDERNLVAHAADVGAHLQTSLRELSSHPLVGEVRGVGLIAAVELVVNKEEKRGTDLPGQLGALVNGFLQQRGVISRNMADALAFCPPLIITKPQVDDMVNHLRLSLDDALKARR
ncbi:4-aminobutyrate--pyruvate transaminase [Paraburkholderia sp. BL27I4N3]|uniref:aspartate aminotransferase family protein n=1 Tax=Paraburkholderia sp. BL27I4N3 TaxID=1938805 RepID=UPI000E23ABF8|nr:aspartate aminotransferase family protein [Paraburkholderia sp. BL27I4N3]REE07477.1 4-aminobutyrate--pyruvate transaminase [Paraburkholderia sp. BL27I4N3]